MFLLLFLFIAILHPNHIIKNYFSWGEVCWGGGGGKGDVLLIPLIDGNGDLDVDMDMVWCMVSSWTTPERTFLYIQYTYVNHHFRFVNDKSMIPLTNESIS